MTQFASSARKVIIRMAMARAKPGSGSSATFLRRRSAVREWPDLASALDPIPWAVVGGVATRRYMPERTTLDLDVMIQCEQAAEVRRRLEKAGFVYQQELSVGGSAWVTNDGTEVDVLESREPWQAEAIQRARDNRDPQGLPIFPFEFFVLLKFQSGRVQDLADVSRMLGLAMDADIQRVRSLFARLDPSSVEDLESLITLGRLEVSGDSAS